MDEWMDEQMNVNLSINYINVTAKMEYIRKKKGSKF